MTPSPAAPSSPLSPDQIRAEFDLPSGKHVVIRKGKGRDLRLAALAAGPKPDGFRILFAQIAQLALIDGKRMPLEAIDDLDWDDAQELIAEAGKVLVPLSKLKGLNLETSDGPEADQEKKPEDESSLQ